MPRGFHGTRTLVTLKCPICSVKFVRPKSFNRICCSKECGIALRKATKRKKYKQGRTIYKRDLILIEMRQEKEIKELHLNVILGATCAFDEGIYL